MVRLKGAGQKDLMICGFSGSKNKVERGRLKQNKKNDGETAKAKSDYLNQHYFYMSPTA